MRKAYRKWNLEDAELMELIRKEESRTYKREKRATRNQQKLIREDKEVVAPYVDEFPDRPYFVVEPVVQYTNRAAFDYLKFPKLTKAYYDISYKDIPANARFGNRFDRRGNVLKNNDEKYIWGSQYVLPHHRVNAGKNSDKQFQRLDQDLQRADLLSITPTSDGSDEDIDLLPLQGELPRPT